MQYNVVAVVGSIKNLWGCCAFVAWKCWIENEVRVHRRLIKTKRWECVRRDKTLAAFGRRVPVSHAPSTLLVQPYRVSTRVLHLNPCRLSAFCLLATWGVGFLPGEACEASSER